ncbi:hypothetical protein [Mangrovibacillus cuniculi]|uniref:Uncharacterized protein n=1 Tax=Mangrovibacillus cuniculi TaxID=2593652 RepID=A0A7S8C8Z3_9BACI|nr:hypothetical protein [Mangrovibacillus cuniculi]QPC45610.1 hypothetical protein G8O30_00770 [Mangrovibacillus cuniculi]
MKKQLVIYTLLSTSLIALFTLWLITSKEKDLYEEYLSGELVNQIVRISVAPSSNLSILEDVLTAGTITRTQAEQLQMNFSYLTFEIQDVIHMAISIQRTKDTSNNVTSINSDYVLFFIQLDFQEDEIQLSEEQLASLKIMNNLMGKYTKVVGEKLKFVSIDDTKGRSGHFFDYYREKGLEDDYWLELLNGFEKVTEETDSLDY